MFYKTIKNFVDKNEKLSLLGICEFYVELSDVVDLLEMCTCWKRMGRGQLIKE